MLGRFVLLNGSAAAWIALRTFPQFSGFPRVTADKLLTIELLFHAQLALLLLTMPQFVIKVIGWPPVETTFWPRLVGAILAGIALATLTTLVGWTKDGAGSGIGLAAEIVINLTVAFVLFSILSLGPAHPTKRGAIFTGFLATALVVLALVEVAYV